MKEYFVYIITNKKNGTLYTGITNELERRMNEHKNGEIEGFSKKYGLDKLVFFETYDNPNDAIYMEKKIKGWVRRKKIKLIEEINPNWLDLCVCGEILRR